MGAIQQMRVPGQRREDAAAGLAQGLGHRPRFAEGAAERAGVFSEMGIFDGRGGPRPAGDDAGDDGTFLSRPGADG